MKIGFVLDDSLDMTDGVQQYILNLGQWLHTRGHEVHYLVGQTERTDIPHLHSLSRNKQVQFNHNRMSTPLPADKSRIKKLLAREQFDVLHVQVPYSPFMAGRVIRAAGKHTAVFGTFHIAPFSKLEKLATKALGVWVWRTNRRFDALFSVSKPAHDFALKSFGLKSKVLPNVVNVSQFQTGKRLHKYADERINIVFLGRLVERKGAAQLVQAIQVLNRRGLTEKIRVVICGKGQLEESLKGYVVQNGLQNIVEFAGFIEERSKPDYLASAHLAVFPSTGGESFGIVLIEAMASGAEVVIGGNNIGYSSVLGNRPDQLVDPNDSVAFADTLAHFIKSTQARAKAAQWQRQEVEQYDVNTVGAKLERQYQEVIAKRARTRDND